MIALSVAAVLAVFLLYTSIAGGGTPSLKPSELQGHTGRVSLAGVVAGPQSGDGRNQPLRFRLRDIGGGRAAIPVRYEGSVPDLFKVGRHIVVDGTLQSGTFVAVPGTLVTKCPSKYAPKKQQSDL